VGEDALRDDFEVFFGGVGVEGPGEGHEETWGQARVYFSLYTKTAYTALVYFAG
jgi:hypothetical protein